MSGGPLHDPGLQPERTSLAWRRTALSLSLGAIVSLRILPEHLDDPLWIGPGILGLGAAAAIWAVSRRRFARFSEPPQQGPPRRGAGMLCAMTLLASSAGALGVAVVL